MRAVPVFEDFSVQILFGGNTPSVLRLPIMPYQNPSLVCSDVKLPRGKLRDLSLGIHSDSDHAGLLRAKVEFPPVHTGTVSTWSSIRTS
ncbi:MAG: hypothetical protein COB96_00110 [Planctomycetota bacterium]|nr:MAG: hypothetical protein COB96_00110 [Planctomycetota bacterium]